jgi:uncharacterized protein with HEPN domain
MRGMRNVVVHDYMSVDMRVIWKTVTKDLPDMCSRLEDLQNRFKQEN